MVRLKRYFLYGTVVWTNILEEASLVDQISTTRTIPGSSDLVLRLPCSGRTRPKMGSNERNYKNSINILCIFYCGLGVIVYDD